MRTRQNLRWMALGLCVLMLTLGTVAWAAEPAATTETEAVDVDTQNAQAAQEILDLLRVAAQYSDPGSLVRGPSMAIRCNCNLQTGTGFCAVGQTCQACPCLSTQGAFLNAVCK